MATARERSDRWATAFKEGILRGTGFFIAVLFLTGITVLFAQALNTFNERDVLSAALMNENFSNIKTTIASNHGIAAPQGAIMAFYLSACPAGWVAADGTNSTPDLRGMFIRGLNNFGTGARSDGSQDPDGLARAFNDAVPQGDQNRSHSHSLTNSVAASGAILPFHTLGCGCGPGDVHIATPGITSSGGSEARPRNHALIYCMRKD